MSFKYSFRQKAYATREIRLTEAGILFQNLIDHNIFNPQKYIKLIKVTHSKKHSFHKINAYCKLVFLNHVHNIHLHEHMLIISLSFEKGFNQVPVYL